MQSEHLVALMLIGPLAMVLFVAWGVRGSSAYTLLVWRTKARKERLARLAGGYNPPSIYSGVQIIESRQMTIRRYIRVKRTWRKRLFSRLYGEYWAPFRETHIEIRTVPNPGAIILNGNTFVMHPATAANLRRQLEQDVVL